MVEEHLGGSTRGLYRVLGVGGVQGGEAQDATQREPRETDLRAGPAPPIHSANPSRPSRTPLPGPELSAPPDTVEPAELVVCSRCRRVQLDAPGPCVACGAEDAARASLAATFAARSSGLVRYAGDSRFLVAAVLALATLIAVAALMPRDSGASLVLVGAFLGIGAAALRDAQRAGRRRVEEARVAPPASALGLDAAASASGPRSTITGTAQRFERMVDAALEERECLGTRLDLRAPARVPSARPSGDEAAGSAGPGDEVAASELVAQWLDVAEFVLVDEHGGRTVVSGVVYLDADDYAHSLPAEHADARVAGRDLATGALGGEVWASEIVLVPSARVTVRGGTCGALRTAPNQAFHRDAGTLGVLCGSRETPVIVHLHPR